MVLTNKDVAVLRDLLNGDCQTLCEDMVEDPVHHSYEYRIKDVKILCEKVKAESALKYVDFEGFIQEEQEALNEA